jgi:hypothetical protein
MADTTEGRKPRSHEQCSREDEGTSKDTFDQRTDGHQAEHEPPGPERDGLPKDHAPSPHRSGPPAPEFPRDAVNRLAHQDWQDQLRKAHARLQKTKISKEQEKQLQSEKSKHDDGRTR